MEEEQRSQSFCARSVAKGRPNVLPSDDAPDKKAKQHINSKYGSGRH